MIETVVSFSQVVCPFLRGSREVKIVCEWVGSMLCSIFVMSIELNLVEIGLDFVVIS